jgi:hypothetical protein
LKEGLAILHYGKEASMSSILNDVKEQLGIVPEYTHFDPVLITHINSAFMILHQLGVGPDDAPYTITDANNDWSEFFDEYDGKIEGVKSYVSQKVRYLWDTPTVGAVKDALEKVLAEYEWRLQVESELLKQKGD